MISDVVLIKAKILFILNRSEWHLSGVTDAITSYYVKLDTLSPR